MICGAERAAVQAAWTHTGWKMLIEKIPYIAADFSAQSVCVDVCVCVLVHTKFSRGTFF